MKTIIICIGLFLLAGREAKDQGKFSPNGTIYGKVFDKDAQLAKALGPNGIGLTALPLGVALGARLPHVRTNRAGEYRFENIPWWGKYTVYPDDEDAGFSMFSTGYAAAGHQQEVELTPEHREAEFNVYLPPKAGLLRVDLTDRRTGNAIRGILITVNNANEARSLLYSISCASDRVILIPPDKDILLHVSSDGYREWEGTSGNGKPIRLSSGTRLTLTVQLEPLAR